MRKEPGQSPCGGSGDAGGTWNGSLYAQKKSRAHLNSHVLVFRIVCCQIRVLITGEEAAAYIIARALAPKTEPVRRNKPAHLVGGGKERRNKTPTPTPTPTRGRARTHRVAKGEPRETTVFISEQ